MRSLLLLSLLSLALSAELAVEEVATIPMLAVGPFYEVKRQTGEEDNATTTTEAVTTTSGSSSTPPPTTIIIGGPTYACIGDSESNPLCPCATADMCCPKGHLCCATGHPNEETAEAKGFSSGRATCSDMDVAVGPGGFTKGAACAPDGGSCCRDGGACAEGQQCCGSAGCIPAEAQCCVVGERAGVVGYCPDGTVCSATNEVCVIDGAERLSLGITVALALAVAHLAA
jgi:hypothetical protein